MAASFGERLLTEVSEEGLDEVATCDHSKTHAQLLMAYSFYMI